MKKTESFTPRDESDMDYEASDVCLHGKSFSEICVDCCPEDGDGSWDGDEWSGG